MMLSFYRKWKKLVNIGPGVDTECSTSMQDTSLTGQEMATLEKLQREATFEGGHFFLMITILASVPGCHKGKQNNSRMEELSLR